MLIVRIRRGSRVLPMVTKKISFDIDSKSLKKLDKVAKIADRPRAYILKELVDLYLDELEKFYSAVDQAKHMQENVQEERQIRLRQKRDQLGKGGTR